MIRNKQGNPIDVLFFIFCIFLIQDMLWHYPNGIPHIDLMSLSWSCSYDFYEKSGG